MNWRDHLSNFLENFLIVAFIVLTLIFVHALVVGVSQRNYDLALEESQSGLEDIDKLSFRFFKKRREGKQLTPEEIDEEMEVIEDFHSEESKKKRRRLFPILDPDRPKIFDGSLFKNMTGNILKLAGSLLILILVIDFGKRRLFG